MLINSNLCPYLWDSTGNPSDKVFFLAKTPVIGTYSLFAGKGGHLMIVFNH